MFGFFFNSISFEKKLKTFFVCIKISVFFCLLFKMLPIRIVGDNADYVNMVKNVILSMMQECNEFTDIQMCVTHAYTPDKKFVDIVCFNNIKTEYTQSNVVIHKQGSNVEDNCKLALNIAGYIFEDKDSKEQSDFFQESTLEKLEIEHVKKFIQACLESQKLTVRHNLANEGFYDIMDKSIGQVVIRKENAIVDWFIQYGLSRSRFIVKKENFGWRVMLTNPRKYIQFFQECPKEWDENLYAVFCSTSDFKSVSRLKKYDMMDTERFVTARQVEKIRELAKLANFEPTTRDIYVMVDKSLFVFE